jgi:hypothetical protein
MVVVVVEDEKDEQLCESSQVERVDGDKDDLIIVTAWDELDEELLLLFMEDDLEELVKLSMVLIDSKAANLDVASSEGSSWSTC